MRPTRVRYARASSSALRRLRRRRPPGPRCHDPAVLDAKFPGPRPVGALAVTKATVRSLGVEHRNPRTGGAAPDQLDRLGLPADHDSARMSVEAVAVRHGDGSASRARARRRVGQRRTRWAQGAALLDRCHAVGASSVAPQDLGELAVRAATGPNTTRAPHGRGGASFRQGRAPSTPACRANPRGRIPLREKQSDALMSVRRHGKRAVGTRGVGRRTASRSTPRVTARGVEGSSTRSALAKMSNRSVNGR